MRPQARNSASEWAAVAILVVLGTTHSAPSLAQSTAPGRESGQVCAYSEPAKRFLQSISSPYALDGQRVTQDETPEALASAASSDDARLAELTALFNSVREIHEAHQRLVRDAQASTDRAVGGFALDAAVRLAQSLSDRDDAPPIGIIGDAYSRQSKIASAWLEELFVRLVGRSACNLLADRLRD